MHGFLSTRSFGALLIATWLGCGGSATPPWGTGPVAMSEGNGSSGSSSASSGSSGGGSSGYGPSGSSSGQGTVATGGFTASGQIDDAVTGVGLPGVAICILNASATCTTSDSGGNYTLLGVADTGSGITGTLSGYATGVWPMTPAGDVLGWTINLRSLDRMESLAESVGTTFGSSAGAIYFAAYDENDNPLSGVSFSVPEGGPTGYFTGDGSGLSPGLTATSTNGGGYIFAQPAGTLAVTATASGLTCTRSGASGWPPVGSETMDVPVVVASVTLARAVCQ
jgi:hypothetical protein